MDFQVVKDQEYFFMVRESGLLELRCFLSGGVFEDGLEGRPLRELSLFYFRCFSFSFLEDCEAGANVLLHTILQPANEP